jgi:immunity protein 10 of polymorphic toxin system
LCDELSEFKASYIYSDDDGDVVTVGFADQQYDTQIYILLQRTLHPSKQDLNFGHDNVHIMVCEQSRAKYGGVEQIELHSNQLIITLSADTAKEVKTKCKISVDISAAEVDFSLLKNNLRNVCSEYVNLLY